MPSLARLPESLHRADSQADKSDLWHGLDRCACENLQRICPVLCQQPRVCDKTSETMQCKDEPANSSASSFSPHQHPFFQWPTVTSHLRATRDGENELSTPGSRICLGQQPRKVLGDCSSTSGAQVSHALGCRDRAPLSAPSAAKAELFGLCCSKRRPMIYQNIIIPFMGRRTVYHAL